VPRAALVVRDRSQIFTLQRVIGLPIVGCRLIDEDTVRASRRRSSRCSGQLPIDDEVSQSQQAGHAIPQSFPDQSGRLPSSPFPIEAVADTRRN
jgi:hypothetical protein